MLKPAIYFVINDYHYSDNMLSCDIGESLKDDIANQNNEMKSLKNTVDVLRNTLQNLLNCKFLYS